MEQKQKELIAQRLKAYVAKYPSQNKAVGSLKGTSAGTVSCIMNGRWENISEEMWKKVGDQVGALGIEDGWQIVETGAYQEINYALNDAQQWKNVTWIVGEAACGKTTTAKLYAEEHKEVFYLQCSEDLHKGEFVREIARLVGIRTEGYTVRGLWTAILDNLIQMDAPLLIFDEADKLTESVFHYFISLYNKLEDTTANDVYAICTANGLRDRQDIDEVIRDAEACDFDLRRVKKSIHRVKRSRTLDTDFSKS